MTSVKVLGNGLINDTFLIDTDSGRFVLQRINSRVFAEPRLIMANLSALNDFIALLPESGLKLRIPKIIRTISGDLSFQDDKGDIWRALQYLGNTVTLEVINDIGQAEQVGLALGHFHRLTSDLPAERLYDTLPGFHIAPAYLSHYLQIIEEISIPDSVETHYCRSFIARRQALADVLEDAKRRGLLVERIIHGDPKLNNFLFDKDSGKVTSLIDLDTVKPGLVHYDIGDGLRSLCHVEATGEFDTDICEAVLRNYLAETGAFFSKHDYRYLYPAIRLIPFELGLRFFSDYLSGNVYFKVSEPDQNLHRAIAQFKLCESIENQRASIERMVEGLAAKKAVVIGPSVK